MVAKLKQLLVFLDGNKTYISVGALLLIQSLKSAGTIQPELAETLTALAVGGAAAALRHALAKLEPKK